MTGRPRDPSGGTPRRRPVRSIAEGQDSVGATIPHGHATPDAGPPANPPATRPDDERARTIDVYKRLGDTPPTFNVARNDAAFGDSEGAHTLKHHGPDVPLHRDPAVPRTIEGRIYGDGQWSRSENWSYRWTDHTTMNREINRYVRENWEKIRNDLATEGTHSGAFNAGHRVGEGFYNDGAYGAGQRQSRYAAASLVRVSIDLVPGSDPPQPFLVTAFPSGIVPFGLL